jgi:hypothetical protein
LIERFLLMIVIRLPDSVSTIMHRGRTSDDRTGGSVRRFMAMRSVILMRSMPSW